MSARSFCAGGIAGVRSGALALLLPLAGCTTGPRLHSADLELVAERAGEGRPNLTALALDENGSRLVAGDYAGGLTSFAVADLLRNRFAEPMEPTLEGGVLALGTSHGTFVAVPRRGAGYVGSCDAAAGEPRDELQFAPLSGAIVTPALDVVAWSVVAKTLSFTPAATKPANGSTTRRRATNRVDDLRIVAAAALGDRIVDLAGRAPEPSRLELRTLPSFDVIWSIDLGHAATAVAVDTRAERIVVSDGSQLELRSLADGALRGTLAVAGAVPYAFGDGWRFLLVQDETLSVLHLCEPPRIEPAFVAHRGGVISVAISADARWLATGGARGDLLLFSISPPTP